MRRRALTVLALAAAVLMAASGCGTSAPTAAEDRAQPARMVLTSKDLPGYAETPHEGSGLDVDRCIAESPVFKRSKEPRGASGAEFSKDNDTVQIHSGAMLWEKESEARDAVTGLRAGLFGECAENDVREAFSEAGDVKVSITPLPALPVGDESVGSRTVLEVTSEGRRVVLHFDAFYIRDGRALGGILILQTGSPFPEAERTRLATLMAGRLAQP